MAARLPGECSVPASAIYLKIATGPDGVRVDCEFCHRFVYFMSREAELNLGAGQVLKMLLEHAHPGS